MDISLDRSLDRQIARYGSIDRWIDYRFPMLEAWDSLHRSPVIMAGYYNIIGWMNEWMNEWKRLISIIYHESSYPYLNPYPYHYPYPYSYYYYYYYYSQALLSYRTRRPKVIVFYYHVRRSANYIRRGSIRIELIALDENILFGGLIDWLIESKEERDVY